MRSHYVTAITKRCTLVRAYTDDDCHQVIRLHRLAEVPIIATDRSLWTFHRSDGMLMWILQRDDGVVKAEGKGTEGRWTRRHPKCCKGRWIS